MIFPNNFFQDEYREGFLVSEMMKRAWAAAFDVLDVVINICHKHDIPYFADGGTLLGGIRHHGFIPWDDDIDITLKREDYNRLIELLPHELPQGFVLAGMYATEKRLQDAAKVQHLRVIADETYWDFFSYIKRFHGFPYSRIGIDIFPLDYIPRDDELALLQKNIISIIMNVLTNWKDYHDANLLEERISYIEELCNIRLLRNDALEHTLWLLLDSVCALYSADESDELTSFSYYLIHEPYHMKKECYDSAIYIPFETTKIAIPIGYDDVLTAEYGDYMTPVQGTAIHDYPFYKTLEPELQDILKCQGITADINTFCRYVLEH